MADKELLTALLELKDTGYIAKEEALVTVSHHHGRLPCPTCGQACLVEDHTEERVIRHLDMWQAKTFMHYVTILTDLEGRRILEVTPDRTRASLVEALKSLDARQIAGVAAVSMDIHEPYRLAVSETFRAPQPAVVHDRFHTIKHANEALNDVWKEAVRELRRRTIRTQGDATGSTVGRGKPSLGTDTYP